MLRRSIFLMSFFLSSCCLITGCAGPGRDAVSVPQGAEVAVDPADPNNYARRDSVSSTAVPVDNATYAVYSYMGPGETAIEGDGIAVVDSGWSVRPINGQVLCTYGIKINNQSDERKHIRVAFDPSGTEQETLEYIDLGALLPGQTTAFASGDMIRPNAPESGVFRIIAKEAGDDTVSTPSDQEVLFSSCGAEEFGSTFGSISYVGGEESVDGLLSALYIDDNGYIVGGDHTTFTVDVGETFDFMIPSSSRVNTGDVEVYFSATERR